MAAKKTKSTKVKKLNKKDLKKLKGGLGPQPAPMGWVVGLPNPGYLRPVKKKGS